MSAPKKKKPPVGETGGGAADQESVVTGQTMPQAPPLVPSARKPSPADLDAITARVLAFRLPESALTVIRAEASRVGWRELGICAGLTHEELLSGLHRDDRRVTWRAAVAALLASDAIKVDATVDEVCMTLADRARWPL